MKLVIAGGTGFLGTPLAWTWAEEGHDVRVLTRALPPGEVRHESGTGSPGISRVGWLAGWFACPSRRDRRRRRGDQPCRRVDRRGAMDGLAQTGARRQPHPRDAFARRRARGRTHAAATFSSRASGIGYYGDRGSEALAETAGPGRDFLAGLCVAWENEALKAQRPGVRVVLLRTGIVLEKSGGALPADGTAVPVLRRRPDRLGPPGTSRGSIATTGARWCG